MTLKDGMHSVAAGQVAMVVTHLEMTAAAPLRGAVLPAGLDFVPLARDPEIYRDLFRRVGQDWLWFGRLTLSDLELCTIIEDAAVGIWTLEKDGQPEAILELDFRQHGVCELAFFGLTPKLIGSGAGAFLMDRAIETAWARDISKLTVHTCTLDSPQALAFYQRSGFTPVKREIELAKDPRALGIYPKTTAPHVPLL